MNREKENLNNENEDEEPMEIGTAFVIKILAIGMVLVSIIIGVPYFVMK